MPFHDFKVVRATYDRAGRMFFELVSAKPFIDLDASQYRRVDTSACGQGDR